MATIAIGKKAPDFALPATGDKEIHLAALHGQKVVLYFYPKDSTPGCTTEGEDFRDLHLKFSQANTIILGISRDNLELHERFKAKHGFPFDLLADVETKVCQLYQVFKEKNMYGKKVMGIERSTFLIDAAGVLRAEWRKVKVAGHVAAVLAAAKAL